MIPKADSAINAIRTGVENLQFVDCRIPHSMLLEIFTGEGVGTETADTLTFTARKPMEALLFDLR